MICRNCKKEIGGAAECPYCHIQQNQNSVSSGLQTGTILAGRYVIGKVAEADHLCITYTVMDIEQNKTAAVKEFFPADVAGRQEFDKERAACVSFFRLSDAERQANALRPGSYVRCPAAAADYFESGKRRFCFDMMQRASADEKFIDFFEENNTVYLVVPSAAQERVEETRADHIPTSDTRQEQRIPEMPNDDGIHPRIAVGRDHTIGLKRNGTVIVAGRNPAGQCNVGYWRDIVAVCAGVLHTVGLMKDGTVVAVGYNSYGQCNVGYWRDIVAIAAGRDHTVGLRKDGTVVVAGRNLVGQCNVDRWRNIVAIAAGEQHTVGLKKDGTVIAVGNNKSGQCNVEYWNGVTAISAGPYHTVGLKSDGTVIATPIREMSRDFGQCDVGEWRNIVAISAGTCHTVGLKKDGTVVSTIVLKGSDNYGQSEVGDWRGIAAIAASWVHTVGLRRNGTVVATKINKKIFNVFNDGRNSVSNWNLNE